MQTESLLRAQETGTHVSITEKYSFCRAMKSLALALVLAQKDSNELDSV